MVAQIPAAKVVHDEVEILMVLEGAFHVDEEGVTELAEDPALVEDAVDVVLLDHALLGDFFHGPVLEGFLVAHLPHPPESTKADLIVELVGFQLIFLLEEDLAIPEAKLERTIILADEYGVAHGDS